MYYRNKIEEQEVEQSSQPQQTQVKFQQNMHFTTELYGQT